MTCKYWDCGWCYKPDAEYSGCVGEEDCIYFPQIEDDKQNEDAP